MRHHGRLLDPILKHSCYLRILKKSLSHTLGELKDDYIRIENDESQGKKCTLKQ
jgi:hypothetical protein